VKALADVKWIKIVTDVFDDEKIQLIDSLPERDAIIVMWFKMLCLAGKQNNGGVFMLNDRIAYTDEMLSTIFRRPLNIVRLALQTFENFGMIEIVNNTILIPNWDKHQSLDKLDQAREKTRKRVAKHREKQKALAAGTSDCNVTCNVTVTECNATDKSRKEKEEIRIDKDVEEEKSGADAPDYNDPDDQLQIFFGNILISENQTKELLDIMGLEVFNEYIARLKAFIEDTGANIKSHYQTLLKWYNEDRMVKK
jgi:predicted phage replisome organizer